MTSFTTTNWAGNVAFGAVRQHRPESIDELRWVVAASEGIRALGAGHSFSQVADAARDLVRLDGLPKVVDIDPAGMTATVSAGLKYAELAAELRPAGFALGNLASLPDISVAGACATGTHGSGDSLGCLAASVAGIELIDPDGDLIELRRDTGRDDFAGAVVALGALGIVTRLVLDIEPSFTLAQHVYLGVPLDHVTARLDEVFGAAYSVSVFTDWRGGEAAVWLKCRTDQPAPRWAAGWPASQQMHPVPGMSPRACTGQLGVPGPWNERLPHFRSGQLPRTGEELQSELFLPRAAAPAALTAIRGIGELVAPILLISELRTVRADDLWLSPAYGRDSVAIHFTWVKDAAAVRPVLAAVEDLLMPLGARPHWGKLTTAAPADIIARYQQGAAFERLSRTLDPAGKFRNALVDGLFPRR